MSVFHDDTVSQLEMTIWNPEMPKLEEVPPTKISSSIHLELRHSDEEVVDMTIEVDELGVMPQLEETMSSQWRSSQWIEVDRDTQWARPDSDDPSSESNDPELQYKFSMEPMEMGMCLVLTSFCTHGLTHAKPCLIARQLRVHCIFTAWQSHMFSCVTHALHLINAAISTAH